MRAKFYTLVLLVSIFSCRSVEKMVEKGEYDKAFSYAIDKLAGQKNKKTEYVKALEKAYSKLNNQTLIEIDKLNVDNKPENWSRVLSLYKVMDSRQNSLEPLLPLISEDGYEASFDSKNYLNAIRNAEDNTCVYYFENAKLLLSKAEQTNEKVYARQAYDELKKIERYKANYKESDYLKNKALELGLTTINFDVYNKLRDFHGNDIERELMTMPVSKLDDLWFDFSMGTLDTRKADYVVAVILDQIDFTPERERLNTYSESKEILVKKEKVKEIKDSTVVWIEKEVYENVRANITEIFREKKSELHGRFRVINTLTNEIVKDIPINIYHDFSGYACRYDGSEKALTDNSKRKLDGYLEFFPSDFDMAHDLAAAFKNTVMNEAKKVRYE